MSKWPTEGAMKKTYNITMGDTDTNVRIALCSVVTIENQRVNFCVTHISVRVVTCSPYMS
jgi:hypothetical protein